MKKIRIGMVCPYGWDTPGGVQTHIRDLTQHLIDEGHYVSVLAPVSDDSIQHEDYLVNAGKPVSIPVNGFLKIFRYIDLVISKNTNQFFYIK